MYRSINAIDPDFIIILPVLNYVLLLLIVDVVVLIVLLENVLSITLVMVLRSTQNRIIAKIKNPTIITLKFDCTHFDKLSC